MKFNVLLALAAFAVLTGGPRLASADPPATVTVSDTSAAADEGPACTPVGCEAAPSCTSGCSDASCCGGGLGLGLFDCCLGDPITLFPETCWGTVKGYAQVGYHNRNDGTFNQHPDRLYLHQAYLYAEKKAQGDECCWDWGYRADVVYGTDGGYAQSFGNDWGEYDFCDEFNRGIYGWAIPQAYAEVAYNRLSVKVGHFYTIQGYESVMPTNNFFYSHSFTQFYNEPFTHTGFLGTYKVGCNLEVYGGWTLGWDTGFATFSNNGLGPDEGNNFLGGFAWNVTDNIKVSYATTAGDLGWRGDGSSHSIIFDLQLTERLKYVLQGDITSTNLNGWDDAAIVNYLIYQLNDCWAFGARFEWYEADSLIPALGTNPMYEVTAGLNWRPHANFVLRPEVRYQWGDGILAFPPGIANEETIFGIDGILTF